LIFEACSQSTTKDAKLAKMREFSRPCLFDEIRKEFRKLIDKVDEAYKEID